MTLKCRLHYLLKTLPEEITVDLLEIPYQVHHIKKINIYADYTFQNQKDNLDSISHNNYTIFYHNKLRYRPKALTDAMAISAETVYTDNDELLPIDRSTTYVHLSILILNINILPTIHCRTT